MPPFLQITYNAEDTAPQDLLKHGYGGRTEIYRKHLTTASQADLVKSFEAFKEKCVGDGPAAPVAAAAAAATAAAGGGGGSASGVGGGGAVVGAVVVGGGGPAAGTAAAPVAANSSGYSGLIGVSKDQFENAAAR